MRSGRVVVTGLGAISPLGLTAGQTWDGLCAGRCGIGPIRAFDATGYPCLFAGEVPEYNIREHVPKSYRKGVKLMCRDIELAVIAADEAIRSSGLVTKGINPDCVTINPSRVAVILGAGLISCDLEELAPAVAASLTNDEFDIRKWGTHGMQGITPLWLLKYLPNMLACHVGIIHDLQGPSNTITCGEASVHLAVAEAVGILTRGDSDVALVGGAEGKVNPLNLLRQHLFGRAASGRGLHPHEVCRPFDSCATGSVFGEAGGMIVIETAEHADGRGATVLAEILGLGESQCSSEGFEGIDRDGTGLRMAIEKAMAQAAVAPDQIDLIVPHGAAIPDSDKAEALAIQAALGARASVVPAWPTKSLLSNTGAACGALDLIAAVSAVRDGIVPGAPNCGRMLDGCNLNISSEPCRTDARHVLCCSYTFGGQAAAVVLRKPDN